MYKGINVQMYKCTNVQMLKCTNVLKQNHFNVRNQIPKGEDILRPKQDKVGLS